jgi:RND superfamily putative drug exporter
MTTSIGVGGALLVVSTVFAALTFLPALLCVLGPRINAGRVPYLWRFTMAAEPGKLGKQEQFWRRVATGVMKRPVITLVVVCVILVTLGWPIFSMRVGSTSVTSLPTTSEARQGLTILGDQYPSFQDQTADLIVEMPGHSSPLSASNLQGLVTLTRWLSAQPHVAAVNSLVEIPAEPGAPALTSAQLIQLYTSGAYQQNPELRQFVAQYAASGMAYIAVSSQVANDSPTSYAQINSLRAHASSIVPGFTVLVGGSQASDLDFDSLLFGHFPWTVFFVLLATLVLLTIMFRSLLLPIKAVLMNLISIGASFGIMVFVFQWGHFSGVLGFTSEGYVNDVIPIILFCILFGLSMDYEVFLLSRIREEWLHTRDNRAAVACGLEKTGSVITNAALLFIVVTVAFTFTSELETKEMGIGMTTAILVDATIIRSLLVPATMRLLGRWNWWFPGRKLPPKQQETAPEAVLEVAEVQ